MFPRKFVQNSGELRGLAGESDGIWMDCRRTWLGEVFGAGLDQVGCRRGRLTLGCEVMVCNVWAKHREIEKPNRQNTYVW